MHFARPTALRIEPREDLLDRIRERRRNTPVNAANVVATLARNKPISDEDMLHLVMAAGCHRLVSGVLNSCGVQLDDGVPGWPTPPRGDEAD